MLFAPISLNIINSWSKIVWKVEACRPNSQSAGCFHVCKLYSMQRVQHGAEPLSASCNSPMQTSLSSLPVERCKTDNFCVLPGGFLQLCGIEWVVNSQPTAKCCISHLAGAVFQAGRLPSIDSVFFISTRSTFMNESSEIISEPRGLTWPSWLHREFIKTRLGEEGRRPEGSESNFPSWLNWHVHYCDATDTKHPLLHRAWQKERADCMTLRSLCIKLDVSGAR